MPKESASEAFAIIEHERGNQVEQTETGLAMVIFGMLFSAIPVIGSIGSLVVFIGITLIILGRESFGKAHSRSVIIGATIFFVGAGLIFVESVLYTLFFLSVQGTPLTFIWSPDDALTRALVPYLTTIFAIGAAGAILTSIAFIFFIFFLQKLRGRIFTLAAAGVGVAISVLAFSLLSHDVTTPLVGQSDSLLTAYQQGFNWEIAHSFELQALTVGLLSFIPAIIYAAAYYSVYSNLN